MKLFAFSIMMQSFASEGRYICTFGRKNAVEMCLFKQMNDERRVNKNPNVELISIQFSRRHQGYTKSTSVYN